MNKTEIINCTRTEECLECLQSLCTLSCPQASILPLLCLSVIGSRCPVLDVPSFHCKREKIQNEFLKMLTREIKNLFRVCVWGESQRTYNFCSVPLIFLPLANFMFNLTTCIDHEHNRCQAHCFLLLAIIPNHL